MPKVKGTILLALVKALRSRKEEVKPLLDPSLHHYLEERVLVSAWYPEDDHTALLRVLGKVMGVSSYVFMGTALAQFELTGVYKAALHKGDLGRTMRAFSKYWPLNHDTGQVTVVDRRGGSTITLTGFEAPAREVCEIVSGFVAEAIRMSTDVVAQVTHVRCVTNGAPRCVWEVDLPLPPSEPPAGAPLALRGRRRAAVGEPAGRPEGMRGFTLFRRHSSGGTAYSAA